LLHAPSGPFYSPRQLGAVGDQLGRQNLPYVEWCTGQSGAPTDSYSTCPVRDLLPYWAQPTIEPQDRLAHWTLSGAHRTVRCTQPTVGGATRRPLIALVTIGSGGSDSSDNLVHHRTVR
jgi:hypothetical protein